MKGSKRIYEPSDIHRNILLITITLEMEKKSVHLHRDAIPNQVMLAGVGKLRCFLDTMDRIIPDLKKKNIVISC